MNYLSKKLFGSVSVVAVAVCAFMFVLSGCNGDNGGNPPDPNRPEPNIPEPNIPQEEYDDDLRFLRKDTTVRIVDTVYSFCTSNESYSCFDGYLVEVEAWVDSIYTDNIIQGFVFINIDKGEWGYGQSFGFGYYTNIEYPKPLLRNWVSYKSEGIFKGETPYFSYEFLDDDNVLKIEYVDFENPKPRVLRRKSVIIHISDYELKILIK
jgi:hypothetical protein